MNRLVAGVSVCLCVEIDDDDVDGSGGAAVRWGGKVVVLSDKRAPNVRTTCQSHSEPPPMRETLPVVELKSELKNENQDQTVVARR